MIRYFILILLLAFSLSSCKTLKTPTTISEPVVVKKVEVSKAALAHQNADFNQTTLEAKIDAHYDDGSNSQNLTVKLRIEKDKTIWMSGTILGIPMAKILITPNRIQYYEKINKTYFDGDYSLFQQVFGVEMNFEQFQNLLLGQAFFDLNTGVVESKTNTQSFLLTPIEQNPKFDMFYRVNPKHFKLDSQEAIMPNQEALKVAYPEYQNVDGQNIPAQIKIESNQKNQITKIFLDIRQVELGKKLNFPFEIPDGYEKLNFDGIKK